jgi:hypothetical protein
MVGDMTKALDDSIADLASTWSANREKRPEGLYRRVCRGCRKAGGTWPRETPAKLVVNAVWLLLNRDAALSGSGCPAPSRIQPGSQPSHALVVTSRSSVVPLGYVSRWCERETAVRPAWE